jgi:hypothetical protein
MSGASSAPAPTTYNVSSKFGYDYHDFNRSKYSSMFQKPIAERPLSAVSTFPAPNQYDVSGFELLVKIFLIIAIDSKRIKKNNESE